MGVLEGESARAGGPRRSPEPTRGERVAGADSGMAFETVAAVQPESGARSRPRFERRLPTAGGPLSLAVRSARGANRRASTPRDRRRVASARGAWDVPGRLALGARRRRWRRNALSLYSARLPRCAALTGLRPRLLSNAWWESPGSTRTRWRRPRGRSVRVLLPGRLRGRSPGRSSLRHAATSLSPNSASLPERIALARNTPHEASG